MIWPFKEKQSGAGPVKVIAGLGNPGRQYAGTRHNVGFEVIDRLADRLAIAAPGNFDRVARSKFDALLLEATTDDDRLLLLKPTTYMNRSGQSVQAAARFYKVPPEHILVIVDELALPAGKIRLRASGSDGGHNGLKDVHRALGTDKYPRLRIGIDPPPAGFAGKDYVLGRFTDDQRLQVDEALAKAVDCCLTWSRQGVEAAMNRFNAG